MTETEMAERAERNSGERNSGERNSGVIALDDDLQNLRGDLEAAGYRVVPLRRGLREARAVVLGGLEKDFLGMAERRTTLPVIDAAGKTADEVIGQLRSYQI